VVNHHIGGLEIFIHDFKDYKIIYHHIGGLENRINGFLSHLCGGKCGRGSFFNGVYFLSHLCGGKCNEVF
jgi:hypothetical protein